MKVCFADTAYYLALISEADAAHAIAGRFTAAYDGRMVTTSAVLTELGNHLSSPRDRPSFVRTMRLLRAEPDLTIVHVDERLMQAGFELFEHPPDQHWSLTDCISFIVMRERQLQDALTTDHHFAQAGFTVLLK